MQVLNRTHLDAKIGDDHIFPTLEHVIDSIHEATHRGSNETECPLKSVCYLPRSIEEKEDPYVYDYPV